MKTGRSGAVARFWRMVAGTELRRDVLETYGTRLFIVAITLATTMLIARELGPTGRGLYAVAATIGAIGAQFSNLGLHASNVYHVSKDRALLPALIGNTLAVVLLACVVAALGGIGFLLWPRLSPLHGTLLLLALFFVPASLAYMLTQGLLLGVNQVRAYNLIESGGKLLALLIISLLALNHSSTAELFFGVTLLSVAVSFLFSLLSLRRVSTKPPLPSLAVFRRSIPVGLNAYMIACFGFLVLRVDLIMVKYMLGTTEAGYYSISQVLAENTMLFPVVIGLLLFPKLSAIKEKEAKLQLVNKAVLVTAALMLPAVLIAACAASPIIAVAFGRNFLPSVSPFVWLMPGIYFLGIETVMVQLLNSEGFPRIIVVAWIADTIINIVMNLWAIPRYGITGASITSSVCYFLIFLTVSAVVWKRNYARHPEAAYAPSLLASRLMRLKRALQQESPLLVAREILWRAHRAWKKRRLPGQLKHLGHFRFRGIPYYNPDLQSLSARSRALIIAFADEIRAGRYPLLGYSPAELGTRPKWNCDFVSGAEWPYVQSECRESIRYDRSDIKVPYELSRLQFLPILGKAYVLTGNDGYRRAAKDLLSHWIQSNPFPLGVNWTLAMEAALRAISICFLLNLLSPLRPEEQSWLEAVTRSLAQHLLYIEANNEFSHLITSNHYLSNVVALYCLSSFLDGEGMTARRRDYRRRIESEMAKQVYDDGGDYEASIGYQVFVTQLFTTALLLMRGEYSDPPTPAFVGRLRMMFRLLNTVASSSGELPHVGDCDDGRAELLVDDLQQMILCQVEERNSLRISHLLGLGQRLFGEGTGPGDDAAWYGLTHSARIPYSEPRTNPGPARAIKVLPKSGIAVLQHKSAELLFFAIPNGIFGKGSHTHNDKLSFILRVAGREVLSDSGTGCYSRNIATRNRFRSTAAHNTLMIDGAEQNRIHPGPAGLFILGNQAAVSPIQEGRDARGWFLRASHSGYTSLGVTHTRTIHVVDDEWAFVIEDELEGHGFHDFELNVQLAPNRRVEIIGAEKGILCRIPGDRPIQLFVAGPLHLQGATEPSLVSTTYGATVPAVKVRIWGRAEVPTCISTRISWADVADLTDGQFDSAKEAKGRGAVREAVC